jgi:hypothetical protein
MSQSANPEKLQRIEAEYREMPGLKLTAAQASRFWQLGLEDSTTLLETLVARSLLRRTRDGHYVFGPTSLMV